MVAASGRKLPQAARCGNPLPALVAHFPLPRPRQVTKSGTCSKTPGPSITTLAKVQEVNC